MKANELRIGNWYEWDGTKMQCKFSDFKDWEFDTSYVGEPIMITEEWLVKFGFEKREGKNICWDLDKFMIGWYGNTHATWIVGLEQDNNSMNFHSSIHYIHELQNLYHALTGQELTIKE